MKRLLAALLMMILLTGVNAVAENVSTDYMVLVNREYPLPQNWENTVELVRMTNSLGEHVTVEKEAYAAYLRLKEALLAEDIHIDLDSAYRSIAEQRDIATRFLAEYGQDYVRKYVAEPGYSEHHTGLALDLYLNIDGRDVFRNEEMVQYPEIWEKIHAGLAKHGFILRYPQGRGEITGYAYEPWHIRYIGNADTAEYIAFTGITLEEYFAAIPEIPWDVE